MRSVDLIEHEDIEVDLTRPQYEAIRALDSIAVTPLFSGRYRLDPRGKVGAIRLGNLQLVLHPKVTELRRIPFLLGYHTGGDVWRPEFVRLEAVAGFSTAFAESFVQLASRALASGPLRRYRTETTVSAIPSGRMRVREQATRQFGVAVPIHIERDEYTVDTAENQILLAATRLLQGLPELPVATLRKLRKIAQSLQDVRILSRSEPRPPLVLDRANRTYHDVLRLSLVILDGGSFALGEGTLTVRAFLFDMWRIYEDFVTGALRAAVAPRGFRVATQDQHLLTTNSTIRLRPDLVCYDAAGTPVAVIDAKYKVEQGGGRNRTYPEADIYQMLAYCSVLGLRQGHLVYARGHEPESVHPIRNCGITIYCHALDLALEPDTMIEHIDALAARILRNSQG
ncbi:restriction endonuclease [Nocardia sp. NPDC050697]|uniref:McrC family protein n=1 Tax=Nocardia sp. NPDC050697 TaxID=3155158 RepID=UPI0033FA5D3E